MSDDMQSLKERLDSLEASIEEIKRRVLQTQLLMHDIDESLSAAEDQRGEDSFANAAGEARSR